MSKAADQLRKLIREIEEGQHKRLVDATDMYAGAYVYNILSELGAYEREPVAMDCPDV